MTSEKRATYTASASYATLNELGPKTRTVWLVFHGMGYLSRYFARYFKGLDPETNYFIIPQAPSKYYLGPENKHVGASWLTREDTVEETKNVLAFMDAVWENEALPEGLQLVVMGYSQGVSIAARWLSSRRIQCEHLILHSGGIPKELSASDFNYMSPETQVHYHYGLQDPYITNSRKDEEFEKGRALFGQRLSVSAFDGSHEVDVKFLQNFLLS